MNNIVDAVNQNSTNAIQAAVLARLFGGAQDNPAIGGVNQAEPPAQDFVSNAMNNPKPTVMPQLAGARGEISGRGGAMGGIGDALMNMYNSRIARSENEVKFAQEAEQAKKQEEAAVKRFAAEQGIKLKTEKEVLAYKEGLDSSVAETQRTKAQTANILSEMARRDKTPIKGTGGSGIGGQGLSVDPKTITDDELVAAGINPKFFRSLGAKAQQQTISKAAMVKDQKKPSGTDYFKAAKEIEDDDPEGAKALRALGKKAYLGEGSIAPTTEGNSFDDQMGNFINKPKEPTQAVVSSSVDPNTGQKVDVVMDNRGTVSVQKQPAPPPTTLIPGGVTSQPQEDMAIRDQIINFIKETNQNKSNKRR